VKNAPAFVFDMMEPERPRVDRAVLDFVRGHVFDPADFVIRSDGICRLNPEMARMVVARVLTQKALRLDESCRCLIEQAKNLVLPNN
jgi:CRISPR/Cas system-associated endonuclease Cas1